MTLFRQLSIAAMCTAILAMTLPLDALAQRRGGGRSFGGSRSRSYSAPRSTRPSGSFGSTRRSPTTQPRSTTRPSQYSTQRNSFGGSRLNRSTDYTSRYGAPRRTETRSFNGPNGNRPYVVNRYGGMADGFMMGYMMGAIPWYFSMPFHPAFYYSRPYTAANPDGSVGVYPGTFQWGTLFMTLLIVAALGFILVMWLRRRRRALTGSESSSDSSFA
jgi:hypothetical protein